MYYPQWNDPKNPIYQVIYGGTATVAGITNYNFGRFCCGEGPVTEGRFINV